MSAKTNFGLTKETSEHNKIESGVGRAGIRVRKSLKALTSHSILLPIFRTAGQPRIRDVRDLGRSS
jgi:hypothetical protein